jgi:hypothetical protein
MELDASAVVGGDKVDHHVQRGEHPQPEQVELHQPRGGAVVLVPLHHGAPLHPAPLHRDHFGDRTAVPGKRRSIDPTWHPDAVAMPALDVARVRRWCAARVPEHALHQVRVECEATPRHLTIVERRAPWHADLGPDWTTLPVARLRYTATDRMWTLYWRDRNLRFHRYDQLAASPRVDDLLAEIERDPTAIFWGC